MDRDLTWNRTVIRALWLVWLMFYEASAKATSNAAAINCRSHLHLSLDARIVHNNSLTIQMYLRCYFGGSKGEKHASNKINHVDNHQTCARKKILHDVEPSWPKSCEETRDHLSIQVSDYHAITPYVPSLSSSCTSRLVDRPTVWQNEWVRTNCIFCNGGKIK